jgi:hypothetical protein
MSEVTPDPTPIYLQLRSRVLSLIPEEVGIAPSSQAPHVWGVIVEIGYEVGSATLVSLADGTTSLYYSTGGGMLGSGEYTPLAEASKALVTEAEIHLPEIPSSTDSPLPEVGQIRFIILTFTGRFSIASPEKALTAGTHPLSPLFIRAQNTLTQLRLSTEHKRK